MSSELRKYRRRRLRYPVRIDLCDGSAPRDCRLVDIGQTGARLLLDSSEPIGDAFVLILSRNGGIRRQCSVAWRDGMEVGVQFRALDAKPHQVTEMAELDI